MDVRLKRAYEPAASADVVWAHTLNVDPTKNCPSDGWLTDRFGAVVSTG